MLISLKDLFAGDSRVIDFDYKIDLSSFEAAEGGRPFEEPVRMAGGVANRADVVSVSATADFKYHTQCDRCLKPIVIEGSVPVDHILVPELSGEESGEYIVCSNQTLDLDELAVSNIILSLPMKHLCSDDCKGLCPECGRNLNEGPCGCGEKYVNPAFESLKDMIR